MENFLQKIIQKLCISNFTSEFILKLFLPAGYKKNQPAISSCNIGIENSTLTAERENWRKMFGSPRATSFCHVESFLRHKTYVLHRNN